MDPIDIHALADGELDRNAAANLRERIKTDPAAQAEYNAVLNLKDLIRTGSVKYECDDTWRVCIGRLNELDSAKRVQGYVGKYAWSLSAVLFALILGGRYAVKDVRVDSARATDLARIFVGGQSNATPMDPNEQRYARLILKRAKQNLTKLRITEGSRGMMDGVPIDRYMLQDNAGKLALYDISQNVNFEDTASIPTMPDLSAGVIASTDSSQHINCVVWHEVQDGHTWVLAGPRAVEALESVADEVRTPTAP